MKVKFSLLILSAFILSLSFVVSTVNVQAQMVTEDVVKVNHRKPKGPTNKYLGNGEKKKRIKAKTRQLTSESCPTYLAYFSKPRDRREKLLRKRRK